MGDQHGGAAAAAAFAVTHADAVARADADADGIIDTAMSELRALREEKAACAGDDEASAALAKRIQVLGDALISAASILVEIADVGADDGVGGRWLRCKYGIIYCSIQIARQEAGVVAAGAAATAAAPT
jgi:hypothetical protein